MQERGGGRGSEGVRAHSQSVVGGGRLESMLLA